MNKKKFEYIEGNIPYITNIQDKEDKQGQILLINSILGKMELLCQIK